MKTTAHVSREPAPIPASIPGGNPLPATAAQEVAPGKPRRPTRAANGSILRPARSGTTEDGSAGNSLAESLLPAEHMLTALKALKRGDFEVRLAGAWPGVAGQ